MINNILIFGGAGFIGSHLVDYYINNTNDYITIIDIKFNNYINNLYKKYNNRIILLNNIKENIKEYNIIYYLAASVGVINTTNNPKYTIKNNIFGLNNTLELLDKYNLNNIDFLFTSSSEIYGNNINKNEDSNLIIESSSLRWTYAATKLLNEFQIKSTLTNSRIVRLFNIVGERQEYISSVMSLFIYNALNNLPLKIYNSGNQYRTFCYVKDCIKIFINLMNDKNTFNNIYNVGSDDKTNLITINELAKLIIKMTNSKSKIVYMNVPIDDIEYRYPNINKLRSIIKKDLEFTSLETIINNMITSY